MSDPISSLRLTCPSGGQFYICQGNTTQFLGCCASNPCTDGKGSCPQADVRYASFNASDYAEIHTQACANTNATDEWYTCSGAGLKEPFLGCCASNACSSNAGCPTADLMAARLSDDESSAAVFLTAAASVTAGSSETKSMGASSSTKVSSATTTGAVGSRGGSSSALSTGAKAGIGVGCIVALVVLAGVLLFFIIRRRRGVVVRGSEPPTPSSMREHSTTPSYHYDPNQILWSRPSSLAAADGPATKSPAASCAWPYSPRSSPSTNKFSREAPMRSGSYHGLGIAAPASPLLSDGAERQQCASPPQYCASQSHGPQQDLDPRQPHQPLVTLAELDGTDVSWPTREVSRTSLPPVHQPYKPPAQCSQKDKSEL